MIASSKIFYFNQLTKIVNFFKHPFKQGQPVAVEIYKTKQNVQTTQFFKLKHKQRTVFKSAQITQEKIYTSEIFNFELQRKNR